MQQILDELGKNWLTLIVAAVSGIWIYAINFKYKRLINRKAEEDIDDVIINRIKSDNKSLTTENVDLKVENKLLKEEKLELQEEKLELLKELHELKIKVRELTTQIIKLESKFKLNNYGK